MTPPSTNTSTHRRALVTGGGTGIGRAIAQKLRDKGLEVVIVGRRADVLRATAAELGAVALVADIVSEPERVIAEAGPLQVLVNNAGHQVAAPIGQWTAADLAGLYAVHTIAPALLAQAFAAQCEGPGQIIHIASTLAVRPAPATAGYAAAKAGMLALSRALALELAPQQITANALLPGVVPTEMTSGRAEALLHLHPLGRLGNGTDVADAVCWLIDAPWVTGAAIPVDGGLLVRE